ncbi:MAG: hypothetical protein WC492_00155 [Candidatus Micrarchaeia archaeon]
MTKRFASLAAIFLLFMGMAFADFELRTLTVTITMNPDGTAHATEEAVLFITGNQSINLYEDSVVFNDLSSWTTRTGISDLRTHVSRAYVEISDLRVRPQPVSKCNNLAQTCYASLILDYDITPISLQQGGIVSANLYKPRTTKYSLRSEVFSFPRTKTDDIILPKGTTLEMILPASASLISFSRVPDNVQDEQSMFRFDSKTSSTQYFGTVRVFSWSGQTLSQFTLSYDIEQSLEEEITSFFSYVQTRIFNAFFSQDGIAYILVVATILLSLIWLHSLEAK